MSRGRPRKGNSKLDRGFNDLLNEGEGASFPENLSLDEDFIDDPCEIDTSIDYRFGEYD